MTKYKRYALPILFMASMPVYAIEFGVGSVRIASENLAISGYEAVVSGDYWRYRYVRAKFDIKDDNLKSYDLYGYSVTSTSGYGIKTELDWHDVVLRTEPSPFWIGVGYARVSGAAQAGLYIGFNQYRVDGRVRGSGTVEGPIVAIGVRYKHMEVEVSGVPGVMLMSSRSYF